MIQGMTKKTIWGLGCNTSLMLALSPSSHLQSTACTNHFNTTLLVTGEKNPHKTTLSMQLTMCTLHSPPEQIKNTVDLEIFVVKIFSWFA